MWIDGREWKLVPVEPTPDWIANLSDKGLRIGRLESAIEDMLAAAPTHPAQANGQAPAASAQPERAVTVSQLEMLFENEDVDKDQPGYHWRKGWNAAIRRCMDIAYPMYAAPVAAQAPQNDDETEGLRAHIALLRASLAQAEQELDDLRVATQAPAVPEGWKLVPVEPTLEMLDSADDAIRDFPRPVSRYETPLAPKIAYYKAMLAAAPTPPASAAPAPADLDAAFEAVRKRLCKLPKYSFLLDGNGGVRRVTDTCGNWIEFDAAHALFDPIALDAARSSTRSINRNRTADRKLS